MVIELGENLTFLLFSFGFLGFLSFAIWSLAKA